MCVHINWNGVKGKNYYYYDSLSRPPMQYICVYIIIEEEEVEVGDVKFNLIY